MTDPVRKLREMAEEVDDQVQAIQVSIDQVQDQIDELSDQADAISEALMDPAAEELESYLNGKALEFQYPTLTYQGIWEAGQSYSVNDLITIASDNTGNHYVCISGHTSDETNRPRTGASWTTYWTEAGPLSTIRVVIGPTYNSTNISDWQIEERQWIAPTPPPILPPVLTWIVIYEYLGTGWDSDANIIQYQDDWDFGCDYLNHPLGVTPTGPDCVLRAAPGQISAYGINPNIVSLNSAKTILTNNRDKVDASKDVFNRFLED